MELRGYARVIAGGCLALTLNGCATLMPQPLSEDEARARMDADLAGLTANQEVISGPVSIYEAMARALKYNLDYRLELTETTLARREMDVSRWEMLPELVGDLSYNGRDEFSGARSRLLVPPFTQSLDFSTSQDRDIRFAGIALSWNILDFGLSYFRAQQAADRVLIAEEQKRAVLHRLLQDVRTAYWRAVSAERLRNQFQALGGSVDQALEQSRTVRERRLEAPIDALTYQRELLTIRRELQRLNRELSLAKVQLAALMNVRPDSDYQIVVPSRPLNSGVVSMSVSELEEMALLQRAELREVDYRKRSNAKETRIALVELLPGIDLTAGANHSSNSFLFEDDWLNWGAQISWNLLNVLKMPARMKQVEVQDLVLDAQRKALSMAILTQVHVSLAQISHAKDEHATAREYNDTQRAILDQVAAAAGVKRASEQALIRERMNGLLSEVRSDVAYADLENALASLFASVGMDPLPERDTTFLSQRFEETDVAALAGELQQFWANAAGQSGQ